MTRMSEAANSAQIVDLQVLRQSCADCALSQLCLPATITDADLQRLDRVVKRRLPIDRGNYLFHEGSEHRSLFVVRSGSLKTSLSLRDGDTQLLGFHYPGEIIGLDGVATERHQCSAQALERSNVCEIPYPLLSEIASQLPSLQQQLLRIMSREFGRSQQHPVIMGRKQAQARLAIFLRSLSHRFDALGQDGSVLQLSMSRQDLANYLGLVIETVSRRFTRMDAQGIIQVDRKTVRILDHAALDAIADGDEDDTTG